jgi:hypothetical protein
MVRLIFGPEDAGDTFSKMLFTCGLHDAISQTLAAFITTAVRK